jgi:hypothetical protein
LLDLISRSVERLEAKREAHLEHQDDNKARRAALLAHDESPQGERLARFELACQRRTQRCQAEIWKYRKKKEREGDSEYERGNEYEYEQEYEHDKEQVQVQVQVQEQEQETGRAEGGRRRGRDGKRRRFEGGIGGRNWSGEKLDERTRGWRSGAGSC